MPRALAAGVERADAARAGGDVRVRTTGSGGGAGASRSRPAQYAQWRRRARRPDAGRRRSSRARGPGAARRLPNPAHQYRRSCRMKLLYQTHSPYARKVLVFAHEAGLAARLEVVHQETSPTQRNEAVFAENPLGKVPVLVRPGLPSLFDSDVICAYLDTLHGGRKLIPLAGEARWH